MTQKPWSDKDSALLRECAESLLSLKSIAEAVGFSVKTTRLKMRELGIQIPDGRKVAEQPDRKWTPEKQQFLEENGSSMGLAELARALEVNVSTVRIKARMSGIEYQCKGGFGAPRTVWTEDRLAWLREELKAKPVSQIASESEFTQGQIRGAIDDYGLQRMTQAEANRSEWRRQNISEAARLRTEKKYPPEGPWECTQCHETKPLTEFPAYERSTHTCYLCHYYRHVERTCGITREQYQALLEAQEGLCAVCKCPETRVHYSTGRVYMLSVDHDHRCCPDKKSCGKCVRALLCARCNNMLGHIEAEGVIEGLFQYLKRFATA